MYITKTIEVDINIDEEDCVRETKQEIYQELAKQYDLFGLDGLLNHLRENCNDNGIFKSANDNRLNDWISVDDKLPNENETVIVCNTQQKVSDDFLTHKRKWHWSSYDDDTVTHWQPLPQPPKGVKQMNKLLTPQEVLQTLLDGKKVEYRYLDDNDWKPFNGDNHLNMLLDNSEFEFRLS